MDQSKIAAMQEIAAVSAIFMEMVVDLPGNMFRNAVNRHQILHCCPANGLRGAEMQEQRAFAAGADAADLVERIFHHFLLAPRPVRADGETVRFIAHALDEIENRVAHRQRK